jgi:hypothetical protein
MEWYQNQKRTKSATTELIISSIIDERPINPGGFTAYPLLQFYSSTI